MGEIHVEAIATDKDRKVARVAIRTERGTVELFVGFWRWEAAEGGPDLWGWEPKDEICADVLQEKLREILSEPQAQEA